MEQKDMKQSEKENREADGASKSNDKVRVKIQMSSFPLCIKVKGRKARNE